MWWLLLLAADDVGARDVPPSPPAQARVERPRFLPTRYDLRSARASGADDFRLTPLNETVAPRRGRPLAVTAIDDERQRLVIGVKPGSGKNKLGFAYRLRFGR